MTLEELLALLKSGGDLGDVDPQAIIQAAIAESTTAATTSLSGKNKQLLAKLKTAQDSAVTMPEGFDPELWETLLAEHTQGEEDKLKAGEKWDTLKEQLIAQHKTELEAEKGISAGLQNALATQLIDNAAITAITNEKGNAPLLLPHVKSMLKMVSGDDGYSAIVVDSKGEPRYSTVKAGEAMGIQELINEFKTKDTFAAAFEAVNGGGGSHGQGGDPGAKKNPFMAGENYNLTEQVRLKKTNLPLATQMEAAAKEG